MTILNKRARYRIIFYLHATLTCARNVVVVAHIARTVRKLLLKTFPHAVYIYTRLHRTLHAFALGIIKSAVDRLHFATKFYSRYVTRIYTCHYITVNTRRINRGINSMYKSERAQRIKFNINQSNSRLPFAEFSSSTWA